MSSDNPLPSLSSIFTPQSVAVIGATEKLGSVGRTILMNLITTPFGGTVFPVNLKRHSILGIKAYPSLAAIGEPIDLAVIVTPAQIVPSVIQECVDHGVPGAIIISAGFKEIGPEGVALERQIMDIARGKMRIIGPNCLGVMRPPTGFNATFAGKLARPGRVGFISQSGAICTAVLDWSLQENVGFSAFISIGSMLDVDWGDLIYCLGDDPDTDSIVIYMESVGNARSFLSAAREVALRKPIIVIKAGRTDAAAKAAASHTGALAGSDDVLDAAFRRSGVLRVNGLSDIFYMSEVLAKQPLPAGPRLTIVTNAGGPGVLATDALISQGGDLTDLSQETIEEYNQFLPSAWSHGNPVDILGDADPDRYAKALEIAARDQNADAMLVVLTPQDMTDPTGTAEKLVPYAQIEGKPVLASWMGGEDVAEGEKILNQANIPTYPYPDTAVRIFNYMWRYAYNLQGIYEIPMMAEESPENAPDRALAEKIISESRAAGRTILSEYESKKVLAAYCIPTTPMELAKSATAAVKIADEMGYPVVLKIHSHTITHKVDVGGVKLNLRNEEEVKNAFKDIKNAVTEKVGEEHFLGVSIQPMMDLDGYEIIVGASPDIQFGPVILFGTGGSLVEVFKDRSLALPPLNTTLARRMMEQTRIYKALQGVRGKESVDMAELEQLMVRFSQLVVEQPWIKEIDINPLLASPEHILALDARVLLYDKDVTDDQLPELAIRPYPRQYIKPWTLQNGDEVLIRPIRPEDEPMMVDFHKTLSENTVKLTYLSPITLEERISHERLLRICFIDYNREMALVAEHINAHTNQPEIVGVARVTKLHGGNQAEYRMIINDRYQGLGLGRELLRQVVEIARAEKVERVTGYILKDNKLMLKMSERNGFRHEQITHNGNPNVVCARLDL